MNWIQKNYDRALLVFGAVIAVLGSAWIILKATSFKSQFVTDESVPGKKLDALSADPVTDALKRVETVMQWPVNVEIPMFASTPFVVMNDKPTDPFPMRGKETPKLRDPIDNTWLIDNGLDYTSIDVREQDPDRDGFTNLDEFEAKTDPNSSLSKPTFISKLYYAERAEEPLTLRLNSFDAGTCAIAFITKDAQGEEQRRNEFIRVGAASARFEPGRFTVVEVKMETVKRFGTDTLVAVAFVTDAKDPKKQRIRLEQGQPVEHPTYIAKFVYTLSNETFDVKEGEDFVLRIPAGMTITLDEIHADHVVISYLPENAKDIVKESKKLAPPPK